MPSAIKKFPWQNLRVRGKKIQICSGSSGKIYNTFWDLLCTWVAWNSDLDLSNHWRGQHTMPTKFPVDMNQVTATQSMCICRNESSSTVRKSVNPNRLIKYLAIESDWILRIILGELPKLIFIWDLLHSDFVSFLEVILPCLLCLAKLRHVWGWGWMVGRAKKWREVKIPCGTHA